MAGQIYSKTIKGIVYYYYQKSWREKSDPSSSGKGRGSGPSRVRTRSIYLGTADSILQKLQSSPAPLEIHHREFGFVAAVYQTAVETGLVALLRQHIPGERFGLPRWLYFLLPILNRLQRATSKQRLGDWAAGTVLPDLLGFNPRRLNSKTFWYATDDVIRERELQGRRRRQPELGADLFVGLEDSTFRTIEEQLLDRVQSRYEMSDEVLFYDTTNFFTYIEDPARAQLPRTGHNKDAHHHLKQVGLALCVEKEWGIPLLHGLYRGNLHDSQTFSGLLDDLLARLHRRFPEVRNLVLVLDKGNNSEANFTRLQGQLQWIGSLVPSQHPDLLAIPLEQYHGEVASRRYYRCERNLFGIPCVVLLTYHADLAKKQEHSLQKGMTLLKEKMDAKWNSYKRKPKQVPAGVASLLRKSRYGKYLALHLQNGDLTYTETEALAQRRKRLGKNVLFTDRLQAESAWIIEQYRGKDRIEQDFKRLKDPDLIRWRPARHWTDTKIRAFGFCCVMALLLLQIMLQKVKRAGLGMSAHVLKEELSDLREIVMVYEGHRAEMKISHRSSIQQQLWDLFDLATIEKRLLYTN